MLKKFIGDRAFYRRTMAVAVPIMIQNAITNFVSMLDNIMVGQVGELPMSGVAIVNQLLFVLTLCIFGAVSGAGLFTAQFYGSGDREGIQYTFRFKILMSLVLTAVGIGVFLTWGRELAMLFMQGDDAPEAITATLDYGMGYLEIMLWGLVPFAISTSYCSTLRETGQTVVPMVAGIVAVAVNLVLNSLLIFGLLGLPALGVRGAAIATVISRYVELAVVALWTHCSSGRVPYISGLYRSFRIPGRLLGEILRRSAPLMLNECLWSLGMATMNQCFSTRGLDVVAAINISLTLGNVTNVVFLTMGNVVGIMVGQMLGAGQSPEAVKDTDRKLIAFSVLTCLVFGSLAAAISGVFPRIYNTGETVRAIATGLICVNAVLMPIHALNHGCYFTLRAGGKTLITFLFDSGFVWCVTIPVAFVLSRYTTLPILPMFALTYAADVLKSVLGVLMVKKGGWIHNLARR